MYPLFMSTQGRMPALVPIKSYPKNFETWRECGCSTAQQPGELSENILQPLSEQVAAPPGTYVLFFIILKGNFGAIF